MIVMVGEDSSHCLVLWHSDLSLENKHNRLHCRTVADVLVICLSVCRLLVSFPTRSV